MPQSGNADLRIANGSTVEAGNGVILQVGSGATANLEVVASALVGDIIGQTRGTSSADVNIALGEGASLTGAIVNGNTVALTDAQWRMTGDSTVQDLSMGSGSLLQLGDGSSFNTLEVAGNYVGDGGTLLFNTVLVPAALPVMDRALLLPSRVLPCETTSVALLSATPTPLLAPLPLPAVPRTWLPARVRLAPRVTVAPVVPVTSEPDSVATGPAVPVPTIDSAVPLDVIVEASMTSSPPVMATPASEPDSVLLLTRAVPPAISSP
jgi:hypothetical protein